MAKNSFLKISVLVIIGFSLPILAYCFMADGFQFQSPVEAEKPGMSHVDFTLLEQIMIVTAAFGLKPIYVLLSFIIIALLWKDRGADLSALRWALISFFIGENACSVNFMFFKEESLFFEYLHCYGMVVSFGLVTYALIKAIDIRIIKYTITEDKCAMLGLCKKCYKYTDVSCTVLHLYLFAVPAIAVLALMPLSAEIRSYSYAGNVFGVETVFGHLAYQQIYEARVLPIMALVLLFFSWLVLAVKKEAGFNSAKVWLAAGSGALGFSMFRFMLFWSYDYNSLWAETWEEITELLFVAAVLFIVLKRRAIIKRSDERRVRPQ